MTIHTDFQQNTFTFFTDPKLFSPKKIDDGSKLLLETLTSENISGGVLDLGCGYGSIGIILAKLFSTSSVLLLDSDQTAVDVAKQNLDLNKAKNAKVFKADITRQTLDKKFDVIVSNPPWSKNLSVVPGLIEFAHQHLNKGGKFYLVINRNFNTDAVIEKFFGIISVMAEEGPYKVLMATMRYNSSMFGRRGKSERADTFHGQHFLVDEEVAHELVNQVPNNATVIEIGAGDGRLTEQLARKAKRVIAIETDGRMLPKLRDAAKHGRIKVVHADALDVDFNHQGKNTVVIGDIPYHITEPLMQKLVKSNIDGAVLVVGGRFADSVTSETSTRRGPLAELVLGIFNVALLRWIKKESFDPPPRTTSALIKMQRKNL